MQRILSRGGLILGVALLVFSCNTAQPAKTGAVEQDVQEAVQKDKDQAVAAVKVATEAVELLRHQIKAENLGEAAKGHLQRATRDLNQAQVALKAEDYAAARQTALQCYNGLVFSSGIGKNNPSRLNLYYRLPAGSLI